MKQFLRKHLPEQPFSRSTKRDLGDELQDAEKKVDSMKVAVVAVCKRLGSAGSGGGVQGSGPDPVAKEKRVKKLLEHQLGTSMLDAVSQMKDDHSPFRYIMDICGNTELNLAREVTEHEYQVEQMVCKQLYPIVEQDLPNIIKAKKQLTKLLNEKDSALNKLNTQIRQGEPLKIAQAQEEVEETEVKAEQSLDSLASEMFSLIVKESELAGAILQYMKLQRAYHESALHTLTSIVPQLEEHINEHTHKRVFGISLEEHLRVTKREIAFPIELCVCALLELGLKEEGLFRMAASTSRLKRMKLSIDSGLLHENIQLPQEYRDVHVIGSVLKSYLRELPEPLIAPHLHERFLAAVSNHSNEEVRVGELASIIKQLPAPNYNNLAYLIKFLSILSHHHLENKMTPSNIAIVMAPNLLRNAENSALGYDMGRTASINCVTELLVKHADRFFPEDVNFFVTISKENFLYEDGFHPQYGKSTVNGGMSKSMHEYNMTKDQSQTSDTKPSGHLVPNKQTSHSRSNSHDTSLILTEGEMTRTHSNGSLSDVSSHAHGSPKPSSRTKKNKLAPSPPVFVSPDKNQNMSKTAQPSVESTPISSTNLADSSHSKDVRDIKSSGDVDKPDKPPRPELPKEASKIVSGTQTINRSSYKSKIGNLSAKIGQKLSSSRENLAEFASSIKDRRKSLEFEHDNIGTDKENRLKDAAIAATQHNSGKTTISEGCQTASSISPRSSISYKTTPAPPKPVETVSKQIAEPHAKPVIDSAPTSVIELAAKQAGDLPVKPATESTAKPFVEPLQKPVAAPRTFIPKSQESSTFLDKEITSEVQLRHKLTLDPHSGGGGKPAVPERPATLRPQSFRNSNPKNQSLENLLISVEAQQNGSGHNMNTLLERTHLYTVDKQHAAVIQVGTQQTEPSVQSPTEAAAPNTIGKTENCTVEPAPRKTSQTEGSILDVPPSPRPYHKPPRPQIPAPPPPVMVPKTSGDPNDSTDL